MSDGTVGELVAPLFHRHHDYLSTDCPRVLGSPLEGKIRHGSFLELKWLWASGHISHHPSHSVQLPRSFPNTCFFFNFLLVCSSFLPVSAYADVAAAKTPQIHLSPTTWIVGHSVAPRVRAPAGCDRLCRREHLLP